MIDLFVLVTTEEHNGMPVELVLKFSKELTELTRFIVDELGGVSCKFALDWCTNLNYMRKKNVRAKLLL